MSEDISPVHVDDATWFYADKRGMLVVHECRHTNGLLFRTDQILIPWRMIDRARKPKSK